MKPALVFLLACAVFCPLPAAAANYYNAEYNAADAVPAPKIISGPERPGAVPAPEIISGPERPGAGIAAPDMTVEASKSFTVTSIEKCYARLDRADRLAIQRNYVKPYQECQKRLAAVLKKEQAQKAADAKTASAKDTPPESPRQFFRVQKEKPRQAETQSAKN